MNKTGLTLRKRETLDLSKVTGGSTRFKAMVRWDADPMANEEVDVDISILQCGSDLKAITRSLYDLVFYGHLISEDGAITHSGDVQDGGEEKIEIDFTKLDANATILPVILTIHNRDEKNRMVANPQTFGQAKNLTIEIYDIEHNKVVATYTPEIDNFDDTALIIGEFKKTNGKANFQATGVGRTMEFDEVLVAYGIKANY